jgi:hypothetical protein
MKYDHFIVDLSSLSPSERRKYANLLTGTAQNALLIGNKEFAYDVIWNSNTNNIFKVLKLPESCSISKIT